MNLVLISCTSVQKGYYIVTVSRCSVITFQMHSRFLVIHHVMCGYKENAIATLFKELNSIHCLIPFFDVFTPFSFC